MASLGCTGSDFGAEGSGLGGCGTDGAGTITSMDPGEASFSDQVPQALRISLRQQVVTQDPDPELVEALAKKNVKMHTKEEEGKKEGARVFHPEAARALKIKQAVMLDPIEPPRVDEAKIDELVDLTDRSLVGQNQASI